MTVHQGKCCDAHIENKVEDMTGIKSMSRKKEQKKCNL